MVFCFSCSVAMRVPLPPRLSYWGRLGERASAEQLLMKIRSVGERPLQVRPLPDYCIPELVPICLTPIDTPERRLWIVLDHELCALGHTLARQLAHQLQHRVDTT